MYVATSDGVSPAAYTSISGFNRMPGDSVRERMDFYSATMAGVGCFADIGRNWTYHAKPPQVRGLQGPKAFEMTQAKRSEAQCRHFKAVCRAVAAWDRKMSRSKKS